MIPPELEAQILYTTEHWPVGTIERRREAAGRMMNLGSRWKPESGEVPFEFKRRF